MCFYLYRQYTTRTVPSKQQLSRVETQLARH